MPVLLAYADTSFLVSLYGHDANSAETRIMELKERSTAQEHFLDLCHVFEHPTPAAVDPTGENFCFDRGTAKHAGGDGDGLSDPNELILIWRSVTRWCWTSPEFAARTARL